MIYLDHNATTPCAPELVDAMMPFFSGGFGNPSSPHRAGREAAKALEKARESVARLIGGTPEEIIFTGGGTESNNHAIVRGIESGRGNQIVTSEIEHSAVLSTCKNLHPRGIRTLYLPCGGDGIVRADNLADLAGENTGLISVMLANNETGAIQPVKEIADFARARNIPTHCDAVQAAGKMRIDVRELGIDMMSLSAHKFNGPKGVGALFIRRGVKIPALLFGGSQERRLRAGTENVPGIVGMGAACDLAEKNLDEYRSHCADLRRRLLDHLSTLERIRINTPMDASVPNTLNIGFEGVASEALVTRLDMRGICVSSGSACAGLTKTSHVLKAMGVPDNFLYSSIRISLGLSNTADDVERTAALIVQTVREIRALK